MRNPLFAPLYDRVLAPAESRGLADRRAALLADCSGSVCEIGAGTGANLEHYPASVERLVLVEPAPAMRRRLRGTVSDSGRTRVDVVGADGHRLPFVDASFDEVVTTLTLCSMHPYGLAAAEIRRVLRPGGRWRYLEHVAAGADGPDRLQQVLQPVQRIVADGCRLDLRMRSVLHSAGFEVDHHHEWRLPGCARWAAGAVVGVAVAP